MVSLDLLWTIPILVIVAGILILSRFTETGSKNLVKSLIGLFIIVVLLGALTIPIIEDLNDSESDTPVYGWEYDDYYVIDGLESASGALDIVTLGDTDYLHVNDVGNGQYVKDGESYEVTTTKANLDVFLIAGQSNAQYRTITASELAETDPVAAPGTAYYYGTAAHPLSTGNVTQAAAYDSTAYDIYMSIDSDGSNREGHIEGPFSALYYAGTGHKVLTVNVAVGGSTIAYWANDGLCYTHAQEVFTDALSKVDTEKFDISIKSFFWIQGESDVYTPVNNYVDAFNDLYDNLTSNAFNADFKFTFALISQTKDGMNAATAQNILVDETGIYMASTAADSFTVANGLLQDDGVHYTQLADNILAEDFAKLSIRLWS